MRGSTWLLRVFVVAAGVQVTGLFLDRRLLPYSGTVAMGALLAIALASPVTAGERRWPRRVALTGLALLAVTAALVDARTGGYGWPAEFAAGDDGSVLAESATVAIAAVALGLVVLTRTGPLPRWWQLLPSTLFGTLLLMVVGLAVVGRGPLPWERPADLWVCAAVLLPPAIAVVVAALAANIVLAARGPRRSAGAGLVPVVVMATIGLQALIGITLVSPHDDPVIVRERFAVIRPDPATLRVPIVVAQATLASRLASDAYRTAPTRPISEPPPPPDEGIPAVSAPPTWPPDPWTGDTDWSRAMPALRAAMLLLCLVLLVTSLFRIEPHDDMSLIEV